MLSRMGLRVDLLREPEEGLAQRLGREVLFLVVEAETCGHLPVDAFDSEVAHHQVERRDVAEAHQPFGVPAQGREVEAREQAHRSVAAAEGDDGPYRGVVDHLLEVGRALGVGPREVGLRAVGVVGAVADVESPLLEAAADLRRVGLEGHASRWGDDGDRVAPLQVARTQKGRNGVCDRVACGSERVGHCGARGFRRGRPRRKGRIGRGACPDRIGRGNGRAEHPRR